MNKIIAKNMTEDQIQNQILSFLEEHGWSKNTRVNNGHQHGCDITARNAKYGRYIFIECKGDPGINVKSEHAIRETNFVYSLGQIVTRISTLGARYYYGLGLPEKTAKIALRRISNSLAKELCLHIFSVAPNGEVTWYKSNQIGK